MSCRVCICLYWSCRRILNCPELLDIFCSPGTGPAVTLSVETLLSASGGIASPWMVTLCVWPEAIVAILPDCLSGLPPGTVSYTHLRAHETRHDLVCRLLLEKKK